MKKKITIEQAPSKERLRAFRMNDEDYNRFSAACKAKGIPLKFQFQVLLNQWANKAWEELAIEEKNRKRA